MIQAPKVIGDAEHLKALSGAKQRAGVRAWCKKNGIKTFNNNDGWPVTTPAALDRALFKGLESEPDWGYFDDKKAKAAKRSSEERPVLSRHKDSRQKEMDSA